MRLKHILLGVCLLIPLMINANSKSIKLSKQQSYEDRDLSQVIPVEAYWNDESKELNLEFWGDSKPIVIEIIDKMGTSVYTRSCNVIAGNTIQIVLAELLDGTYTLWISDGKTELEGEFYYESFN